MASRLRRSTTIPPPSCSSTPTNTQKNLRQISPRKTRALHKKEECGSADGEEHFKCQVCAGLAGPVGELKCCPKCQANFHFACIDLQPETQAYFTKYLDKWQCPRCIRCSKCFEYIYDVDNVQCFSCGRAYHGFCRPKKARVPEFPSHRWACDSSMCRKLKQKEKLPYRTPPLEEQPRIEEKQMQERLLQQRHSARSAIQDRNSSSFRSLRSGNSKSGDGAFRRLKDVKMELADELNNNTLMINELKSLKASSSSTGISPPLVNRRNQLVESPKSSRPRKRVNPFETPRFKTNNEDDLSALQDKFLNQLGSRVDEQSMLNSSNEWVYLGPFVRFKPIFESSYSETIRSAPIIYICEFCLNPMADPGLFKNHIIFCPWKHPPGNEIYRQGEINIWEVEGSIEISYCRNLCLFARLFLSSKTLYHEVDTFTFYVITEITLRGCIISGYFSKEKNPSKNNNLSCLLTFPSSQCKGYGKLLIDLSYQLSKREHKIGSPEHPLSDMGLLAYRSYWRQVLFSALRRRKNEQHILSIKDLSVETAIHSSDIISTLLASEMILFRHDAYFVDISKALNVSLASLRRRTINLALLIWEPPFEVPENSSKLGSYISSSLD